MAMGSRRRHPKQSSMWVAMQEHEAPPDHTTVSRTRRLIDLETHQAVFTWILQRVAEAGLVQGQTIGIDATTLEANAALRSIVRRDTGERYEDSLTRLAQASGIATPARADLARLDRARPHKGRNDDWQHPHDPDARITKMKDGRTHLAHKAEHGVDLVTGAIVAVTIHDATAVDPMTLPETLTTAAQQVEAVHPDGEGPTEAVADKGYPSNQTLTDLEAVAAHRATRIDPGIAGSMSDWVRHRRMRSQTASRVGCRRGSGRRASQRRKSKSPWVRPITGSMPIAESMPGSAWSACVMRHWAPRSTSSTRTTLAWCSWST
jgi:hypothetical protein